METDLVDTVKSCLGPRGLWFSIAKRKSCSTRWPGRLTKPASKRRVTAVLDTSASGDAAPAKTAEAGGPVSRGYKEEIEHWAWCISTGDLRDQPRCNGPVALADAVIALTSKQAMANSQVPGGNGFIQFQPGWFNVDSNEIPEVDGKSAQDKFFDEERKNIGLS